MSYKLTPAQARLVKQYRNRIVEVSDGLNTGHALAVGLVEQAGDYVEKVTDFLDKWVENIDTNVDKDTVAEEAPVPSGREADLKYIVETMESMYGSSGNWSSPSLTASLSDESIAQTARILKGMQSK